MAFSALGAEAGSNNRSVAAFKASNLTHDYWDHGHVRTVYRSRIIRIGRYYYRDTFRLFIFPNGKVRSQLVRRVRISGFGFGY